MNFHCDTHRQLPHISTQITLTFSGDQTSYAAALVKKATRRTAGFFAITDAGGQEGGGRRSPVLALATGTPARLENGYFRSWGYTQSKLLILFFKGARFLNILIFP